MLYKWSNYIEFILKSSPSLRKVFADAQTRLWTHSYTFNCMSSITCSSDQWSRNEFESWGAPVQSKSGAPIRRFAPEKFFLFVPLHFLALKARLVVLVSAFVMVSTVWWVSCLLFYSQCPLCPAICKSGGHVAPGPVPHGVGATGSDATQKKTKIIFPAEFCSDDNV